MNKQQNKTVTVIVTLYNKENYIRKALDSLINQSVFPDEVIIVNDKSTDNSGSIVKDYVQNYSGNIKIHYIDLPVNSGSANARNKAIDNVTSDYFLFLDADDAYAPSYIESIQAIINKEIDCGMVVSLVRMQNKNLIYPSKKTVQKIVKEGCNSFFDINDPLNLLSQESLFVGGGNVCVRTDLVSGIRLDPHEKNYEEWDFYYKILKKAMSSGKKVLLNNTVSYLYNDSDESSLSRKKIKNIDDIKIPAIVNNLKTKKERKYRAFILSIWTYNNIYRIEGFRNRMNFILRYFKTIRTASKNVYFVGAVICMFFPLEFLEKLKNYVKNIRFKS